MSPAQLADAIGVGPPQISNYERGKNAIDDRRAKLIADVLQLPEITVRRNLGLWVPDEPDGSRPMTVDEFIAQDTVLSPEAKKHYRAQYDLLARLMPTDPPDLDAEERDVLRRLAAQGVRIPTELAADVARQVVSDRRREAEARRLASDQAADDGDPGQTPGAAEGGGRP